jgi:uncharacterized protein (TIGR02099 family)
MQGPASRHPSHCAAATGQSIPSQSIPTVTSDRTATSGAAAAAGEAPPPIARHERKAGPALAPFVASAQRAVARTFGGRAQAALRRTLKAAAIGLVVAYFALALLMIGLRHAVLPRIDQARPWLEQVASQALGADVAVGQIAAHWRSFNPVLRLTDVRLHDAAGRTVLALPQVDATVSWTSVAALSLRLASLTVRAPQVQVRRHADGGWSAAGLRLDPHAPQGDGRALQWLLAQRQVEIRGARVLWIDDSAGAAPTIFEDVDATLRSGLGTLRFALRARPPSDLAAPLDIRGAFRRPLTDRAADIGRWHGRLYLDLAAVDLAHLQRLLGHGVVPAQITRAQGALRAWIDVDRARVVQVTADALLRDVDARLGTDLEPLRLARAQGRFVQQRWGGADAGGVQMQFIGLTLQDGSGSLLEPTDLRWRITHAAGESAPRTELEASRIDLDVVARLAQHVPLARDARDALARHALGGTLTGLVASWDGPLQDPARFSLNTRFERLGSAGRPAAQHARTRQAVAGLPGFAGLSGSARITDAGGTVALDSRDARLQFPGVFEPDTLAFDRLTAALRWHTQPALEVHVDSFAASGPDLAFNARGTYRRGARGAAVDISGTVARARAAAAWRYVPLAAGPATRAWLRRALLDGEATDGAFRLRGELADFPFVDPRRGEFRVQARLRGGRLDYVPAETRHAHGGTAWPAIEQIEGALLFERNRMQITGRSASVRGVRLADVTARISDLGAADSHLRVEGHAAGALADMLGFVDASPVQAMLGGALSQARAGGAARLQLALDVPLAHAADATVSGTLTLSNNTVALIPALPPLTRASGQIEFTHRSLRSAGLSAQFAGGPVRLTAATGAEGIALRLTGMATPETARQLPIAALHPLARRIDGATAYAADVLLQEGRTRVRIDSDLAGWAIDAPAPLGKAAGAPLPLRIEWMSGPATDTRAPGRQTLRASLGGTVAVRATLSGGSGAARAVSGAIGIGVAEEALAPPPKGLGLAVDLPQLDLDAWIALLSSAPDQKGSEAFGDLLPDAIDARVGLLTVLGRPLRDAVVIARHDADGTWRGSVDADLVSGAITWRGFAPGAGLTARLKRLIVPPAAKPQSLQVLDATAQSVPALDVVADEFHLGGHPLGRLELLARPAGAGRGESWQLQKLELRNPDATLSASGQWRPPSGRAPPRMAVDLRLELRSAAGLLGRLGTPNVLEGGAGRIEGQIDWSGAPLAIDLASLNGTLALNVTKGRFLRAEPGAARLLGILSLQSLARRLTLDFRDVFAEGFAFDAIDASAVIRSATASTRDFRMRGAGASVMIEGDVDLARQTQRLRVAVLPESLAGSSAVAVALLANPAVGLGAYLAQLLLKDPIARAMASEFDVTGTWQEPEVQRRPPGGAARPGH